MHYSQTAIVFGIIVLTMFQSTTALGLDMCRVTLLIGNCGKGSIREGLTVAQNSGSFGLQRIGTGTEASGFG